MAADHARHTGARLSAKDIAALAGAGDSGAAATLERYERRFARALAAIVNVLDPDVIVLGGGMSNIDRLYASIPRLWGPFVFACGGAAEPVSTRLVRARHGDASGVRGAAWLWPEP
jgi:predicted NBD/HSP70 family sugar kinase